MTVLEEFFRAYIMLTNGNSFADVCAMKSRKQHTPKLSTVQRFKRMSEAVQTAIDEEDDYDEDDGVAEYEYEREIVSGLMMQAIDDVSPPPLHIGYLGLSSDIDDQTTPSTIYHDSSYVCPILPTSHRALLTFVGLSPYDIPEIQGAMDPYGAVADVEAVYTKRGDVEIRVLAYLDEDEAPEEIEFEAVILTRVGKQQMKKGQIVARYDANFHYDWFTTF